MGRIADPGIPYYKVKCAHIRDPKLKLLMNEFGSDGYWIWQCLQSYIHENNGYYFDWNDKDELELFATDVCKKQVALVEEVIRGLVRRGLLDKAVFDSFGILSSDEIQDLYIDATAERRRKGTEIELYQEFLLVKIHDGARNISIVPWKKEILPRNNSDPPRNNSHSRVEKSIVKKSTSPNGLSVSDETARASRTALKKKYEQLVAALNEKPKAEVWSALKSFIQTDHPEIAEPYVDAWNVFAGTFKLAQVGAISESRKKKLNTRLQEGSFDFMKILEKIKASSHLRGDNNGSWKVTFDWIIENDKNYLKIIEGQYN